MSGGSDGHDLLRLGSSVPDVAGERDELAGNSEFSTWRVGKVVEKAEKLWNSMDSFDIFDLPFN